MKTQKEALEIVKDALLAKYGTQANASKKMKHTESYVSNVLHGKYKGIPAKFLKLAKLRERRVYDDIN